MKLQSGTLKHNMYTPGWNLRDGSGDRVFSWAVTFETKFANPPQLVIGLSGLDTASTKNSRVQVTATNITNSGFDLQYKTWSDTIVYGAVANWLAYGD